jgi:hypothetical protein
VPDAAPPQPLPGCFDHRLMWWINFLFKQADRLIVQL